MIPFESDNLRAYTLLLRIEIALRECLRASLHSEFGPQWRKRLPGDLLKKIKSSQAEENRPNFNFLRLGPLYYLTFGELLTLLQQKTGNSVANKLGGDGILKQLESVFAPRNAVCHSRPVSSIGLMAIETLYAEVETALTPTGLASLIGTPDVGISQAQVAKALIPAFEKVLCDLESLPTKLQVPDIYQTAVVQFWWADAALAGFGIDRVEVAMGSIEEYNSLPAGVGSSGLRQRFCEGGNVHAQLRAAITELAKVNQ